MTYTKKTLTGIPACSRALRVALVVTAIACGAPADHPAHVAIDPALLHAILAGWQEGPTDGRVCLDPRVLEHPSQAGGIPTRWSDEALAVLLADDRVALDTARASTRAGRRTCTPTRAHPRISLAVPVLRSDSAIVTTAAFAPATVADTAFTLWVTTTLVRERTGRWRVVDTQGWPYGIGVAPVR